MINGVSTLFQWSLRADSRNAWPHLVRAVFALFMLFGIVIAIADPFSVTGPGLLFFRQICGLNAVLIFAAGISYFVSAISEEKDTGTLALLKLANVTPFSILLGKSTSRLVSSLMLLAIQLPFTFLSITLGGVMWQQIVAAYLALAAWMALVANVALFCSVRCSSLGRAATLTVSVLVGLFMYRPIVVLALPSLRSAGLPAALLSTLDKSQELVTNALITHRLSEILGPSTQGVDLIGFQFGSNLVVAALLFGWSVLLYNRWSRGPELIVPGDLRTVRWGSTGRCWKMAILWKDYLFMTGGRMAAGIKFVLYGAFLFGGCWWHRVSFPYSTEWLGPQTAWPLFLIFAVALLIELLLLCSGALFNEVRFTTLSTLQMLPIRTGQLLFQKMLAVLLALLPVVFWMLVVFVVSHDAILAECSLTAALTYVLLLLLSSHLTVLFSLYARWAALPLAILVSASAVMCCPVTVIATLSLTETVARQHQSGYGLILGSLINILWMWMFILLPIELEIVKRWDRLGQEA